MWTLSEGCKRECNAIFSSENYRKRKIQEQWLYGLGFFSIYSLWLPAKNQCGVWGVFVCVCFLIQNSWGACWSEMIRLFFSACSSKLMLFEAQQYCFKSQFSHCCKHFIINILQKKNLTWIISACKKRC